MGKNEINVTEVGTNVIRSNDNNVVEAIKNGIAGYNGIKTIAVFSNGTPLMALQDSHYACVPVDGHWNGVAERSLAVINISLEAAAWFAGRFQQTSFIYSRVSYDTIETDFYERQDTTKPYNRKTNPYVIKESVTGEIDISGAKVEFSIVGKFFSYGIGFPAIRSINETISKNYTDELMRGEKSFFHNMTLDEEIDFTMNRVGQSPSIHRGRLYKGLI